MTEETLVASIDFKEWLDMKTEIQELNAEVQRLQRALSFWLPMVPTEEYGAISDRIADDSFLLGGYEGEPEKCAEELGWISLRR